MSFNEYKNPEYWQRQRDNTRRSEALATAIIFFAFFFAYAIIGTLETL